MTAAQASINRSKPSIFKRFFWTSWILLIIKSVILAMLAGIILSVLLEWFLMAIDFWDEKGALHARNALIQELQWTNLNGYSVDPAPYLTVVTGAIKPIINLGLLQEYVLAFYYIAQITVLRIIVIICSIPAVFLIWTLGLLDGLVQRDLRKYQVLHESGFVYHNAKAIFGGSLALPPIVYMTYPSGFHPTLFLLLFAGPSSLVIWTMAARFKKHL